MKYGDRNAPNAPERVLVKTRMLVIRIRSLGPYQMEAYLAGVFSTKELPIATNAFPKITHQKLCMIKVRMRQPKMTTRQLIES